MLILTRRIGEILRIGDDVSLMVVGVQGNQVRIGADAPKEVEIHREEIYRRIQQEKNQGNAPSDYRPAPKPAAPQYKVEENVADGARFYSTDGAPQKPAAKTPNVIIKKKRVFENV